MTPYQPTRTMKKTLIATFAVAILCSCGGTDYTVTGRYELAPGDSVYLYASADHSRLAAGVMSADTTVTLKGSVTTPGMAYVNNANGTGTSADFFLEPGRIQIERYDSGRGYIVSGTPLNDRRKAFEDEIMAFREKIRKGSPGQSLEDILAEMQAHYIRTVDANLDNIFGVWVFNNNEFPNLKEQPEKLRARVAQFSPEMQGHPMLKRSQQQIGVIEQSAVGRPYSDFSAKDTTDQTIALSSLVGAGRWVLIDFWATWCQPCMMEVPHLKKAYETFRSKGLEIYGISLDTDRAQWKKVIEEKGMDWVNVLPRKGKEIDPKALYSVCSIPTNFLISPDGVIVAKNLFGEELQSRLEELIK